MKNAPKPTLTDYLQFVVDEVWYGIRQHGRVGYLLALILLVFYLVSPLMVFWR